MCVFTLNYILYGVSFDNPVYYYCCNFLLWIICSILMGFTKINQYNILNYLIISFNVSWSYSVLQFSLNSFQNKTITSQLNVLFFLSNNPLSIICVTHTCMIVCYLPGVVVILWVIHLKKTFHGIYWTWLLYYRLCP